MKKNTIAKINSPHAASIVPRKRLFRILDNARKQPVLWVAGPAGSGKTSLVASYLDARKLPCLWYDVDAGDADIASFFYYLGLAAKKAAPRYRKPLPLLTPEYLGDLATFTQRSFESLYRRLKPPFAVVFDNYQEVPDESLFHGIMQNAMALVPEGIQVVILSRNEPPAVFSRLRANNAIRSLGWEELRFSLDEAKLFVERKVKLNDAAIEALHAKTEGWAGGLVLLTESAQMPVVGTLPEDSPARLEVFDYFAGEVLDKLNTETRDFLIMSSLLPQMTVQTAIKLTDCENAAAILSSLSRNNFFTEKRSAPELTYQYHSLFREFLLTRMKRSLSAEGLLRMQKRAAAVLKESGQMEDAVELLCAAQDWNSLIDTILGNAQQLISQGRNRTLLEWIERLPREITLSTPWILFWQAVCLGPFNPVENRKGLESAFELFKKEGSREGLILVCLAVLDSYAVSFSDFTGVDRWINELEDLVKQSNGFSSPELETRATFAMFAILYMARPDHPRLSFWFERAKSLMPSCQDNTQRVINAAFLLIYYSWTEFPTDMPSLMNDLRLAMKSPDVPPVIRVMGCLMKAIHGWATASLEACRKAIAEGLETARFHGLHHSEGKLYAQDVYCSTIAGDCAASAEGLHRLTAATNFDNRLDAVLYHNLASLDARCRDDFFASLEHARFSEKLATAGGAPFPLAWSLYNLSQALFHTGNIAEARECAEKALEIARMMKSALIEFSCLLLNALFEFSEKNASSDAKGLTMLRRALSLGKAHTIMNIAGWRRKTLAELCARALEAGIEREFTLQLIRAHRLEPDDPAAVSEAWPRPLRIMTLGTFQLLKDGKPVGFTGKVQHKPLLLLKALIACGGRDVPEEKISDLLWPDSDGDAAHSAFSTTLQRLRSLIGNEKALLLHERRLSLDRRICSVDAWAFERMHERAESLWRTVKKRQDGGKPGIEADARNQGEKAIALYRGSFLPGDAAHVWTAAYRERLRTKFLRLVLQQGISFEEDAEWREAAETFELGLQTDELAEEFYQHLMICYERLGQKAEAVRIYDACKDVLSSALGVGPSKKTESLHLSLLK